MTFQLPQPPKLPPGLTDARRDELLQKWMDDVTQAVEGFLRSLGDAQVKGRPVAVPSATVAQLEGPSPAYRASGGARLVLCSDEAGGAVLAYSDGTNWRRVTDRAIVS